MQWIVSQQRTVTPASNSATFQTDIYIDVNGKNGDNCMYNVNCTKPDIFKFMVAANGTIVPADPMGRKYIATRKSLQKKDFDITNASILTSLNQYKANMLPIAYQPCVVTVVPETPGTQAPITGPLSRYNCINAYISSDPGYSESYCNSNVTMQREENELATYPEAYEDCKAKGLRLPTYLEMSVAGKYFEALNLKSGNYWASYETRNPNDSSQLNCYMPTGNCGQHNANEKQRYRCVQGDWPTKTTYTDRKIEELE